MHVDDDDDDDDDDDLDNLTSFPEPIGQAHDMFFSRIFWVQIHDLYSYQILCNKVHIFWEGHKILRNLPLTFDCVYYGISGCGVFKAGIQN